MKDAKFYRIDEPNRTKRQRIYTQAKVTKEAHLLAHETYEDPTKW